MGSTASTPAASASDITPSVVPPKQETPTTDTPVSTETKPKKKICCACPTTKKLRDECIVEHGESACTKWIEAHLECLRAEGFKV